jgi:hypothetical protein
MLGNAMKAGFPGGVAGGRRSALRIEQRRVGARG